MDTFTNSPTRSFVEETPGALTGKEGFFLELAAAEDSAKLAAGANPSIGVMQQKLQGDDAVTARLLGKGGTVKVKAGGVIAKGDRVIVDANAKAVTLPAGAGTYRTVGIKLGQGNSADGDLIEILDIVESIIVA